MTRRFPFHLAVLLLLSAPATMAQDVTEGNFGVETHQIFVQGNESPITAAIGFDPQVGQAESFGWQNSDPHTLAALVGQFQQPLRSAVARKVAVVALSAPVLPDATANVPADWLLERVQALQRIGEIDAAWRLYGAVPQSALTEPLARQGAELAWTMGKSDEACTLTARLIKDGKTEFPNDQSKLYWLTHYALCQRIGGEGAKAELTVQLLQESAGKTIPPLLPSLIEGWDEHRKLPPLTSRDAPMQAALAALLHPPGGDAMQARIPAGFLSRIKPADLSAPLSASLAATAALDPVSRAAAAETAVRYHLLPADQLPSFYRAIATVDAPAAADLKHRAQLFLEASTAASPDMAAASLLNALQAYHRIFSAEEARDILGVPLRQLIDYAASHGNASQLPPNLVLEAIGLYRDHVDRDRAWSLSQQLGNEADATGQNPAQILLAEVATRIVQLSDDPDLTAEQGTPVIPTLSGPVPAIWLANRYATVAEALGLEREGPPPNPAGSVPLPAINYAPASTLEAFENATINHRGGEAMLRAALLIGQTPPERLNDAVLGRVIGYWQTQELEIYSSALSADALAGMPDAPTP